MLEPQSIWSEVGIEVATHPHLANYLKKLGFEQCLSHTFFVLWKMVVDCGTITIALHEDAFLAVGCKSRCDELCDTLKRLAPFKKLGKLGW